MAEQDVNIGTFESLFSLQGKVAVIIGGSRGLGLSGAAGLLKAGCSKVYITARNAEACDKACELLNNLPGKLSGAQAIAVPADVSKISEIESLAGEVAKTTDHVDILFANAGMTHRAPFLEHTDEAFSQVMDLNVKSVFFYAQKFSALLSKNATRESPSRIVATSSLAGIAIGGTGDYSTPSYCASKAAVAHLMRHLAVDLGSKNILCNSIAPGFFATEMASGMMEKLGGREAIGSKHPNGRVGEARDIAGVLVFLCSNAGSHVNGAVMQVDGGKFWVRND